MQRQTKLLASFTLLMFVAVALALVLVVRFPREENLPGKSPTEYEKTQQPDSRTSTNDEPANREANVEMPNETARKLARAWNQGSSQEIAELFTSDGVLTTPKGSNIQSKSEIAKTITNNRDGPLNNTVLSNTVDEVSQIDANTAVVKGRYQLDGIKVFGLRTAATGTFVLRQLRREGKWLISKAEVRTGDDG
jgi:uncharacterized protein (TIGR02246 family)